MSEPLPASAVPHASEQAHAELADLFAAAAGGEEESSGAVHLLEDGPAGALLDGFEFLGGLFVFRELGFERLDAFDAFVEVALEGFGPVVQFCEPGIGRSEGSGGA